MAAGRRVMGPGPQPASSSGNSPLDPAPDDVSQSGAQDAEQDTPGRASPSSSRQQTRADQSTQTGSTQVDGGSSSRHTGTVPDKR